MCSNGYDDITDIEVCGFTENRNLEPNIIFSSDKNFFSLCINKGYINAKIVFWR